MTCSREKANTHRSTTSIRGGDVAGAVKETELFLGCALSFVAAAEFSGGQYYNDYNDKSIFHCSQAGTTCGASSQLIQPRIISS